MPNYSKQPEYHTKSEKIKAREQVVAVYREITGLESIPQDRGYWTFCARQPNTDGAEIVQLVKCGLMQKNQFFGVDYDRNDEGIIEFNRQQHPEAHWFKGEWLEVIENNYEIFNPSLVYFDYTKTIVTVECHKYLARTMNWCPKNTVVAANLMLSDGHSLRHESDERYDPDFLIKSLGKYLRHNWEVFPRYYPYKSSRTPMGTFILYKK